MSGTTEPVTDDLDDLFGFKAAKQRLEEGTKAEILEPGDDGDASFIKYRVFISGVDSFNARYIASYLTDQTFGASILEGLDEGQGEEEPVMDTLQPGEQHKYQVIGTKEYSFHKTTEDILFTVSETDSETYNNELLKCRYIVFDISQKEEQIQKALDTLTLIEGEIEKVKDVGPKTFGNFTEERVFILISTVMTWGKTKPLNPRDPSLAFTEANYKKRKAHPNYEKHIACEREVVLRGRKYRENLKTYVICAGIIYGQEQQDLLPLFKLAWLNEPYLPCFMPGNNYVPVIHIGDLARVLHKLMEMNPGIPQFILAVEPAPTTLKKITIALAKTMGSERVKNVSQAEAFLYPDIKQQLFERCTLNLRMEPEFASDALQVEWQTELNMAQNMKQVVSEFVNAKNLIAKKVVIHGPPASGKTTLAKMIVEKYGLHYISIDKMIQDILEYLRNNITDEKARIEEAAERAKEKEVLEVTEEDLDEEEVEEEEEGGNIEEWEEQIHEITTVMGNSENGKLPDEMIVRLLRTYLAKNVCQYKGYVLDGYPKTYEQAKEIFGQSAEAAGGEEGEGEEDEMGGMMGNASNKILPQYVISLQASDDFLNARVMGLPESKIQGTHYDEKGMLRRLAEYRGYNTEDNTVLNFFDEIEIHPIIIKIDVDQELTLDCIFQYIQEFLQEPTTLGLTPEEEEELNRLQQENERLLAEQLKLDNKMKENECQEEFQDKMEQWADLLQKYQIEEHKLLIAKSEPLRFYLVKYVFPILIKGLVETAKIKPPEPLTFLAEFLFRENPEGKMFDPSYSRDGETLLGEYDSIEDIVEQNIPE